jgi:hypothetical protein
MVRRLARQQPSDGVILAVVNLGEEDSGQRFPTKQIYVFPEGTKIKSGHTFWDKWHKSIDYVAPLTNEVRTTLKSFVGDSGCSGQHRKKLSEPLRSPS